MEAVSNWTSVASVVVKASPRACDCDGNVEDGVCGGDCTADADADGICDDEDDCVVRSTSAAFATALSVV